MFFRQSMITAIATLAISSATMTGTAQAFVAGPAGAVQRSAQSLDMTQRVRRVCSLERRCTSNWTSCHWERVCRVTADYPPENGNRR